MKARWLAISATALLFIGAGLVLKSEARVAKAPVTQDQAAPEELAKKNGCFECHNVDKNLVGPAYKEVAARYRGKAGARAALIETVKKGGKGHWSDISKGVPMPPHQGRLSTAEITRLVDWVLSLGESQ
jgi:cytochrome c